jgi:hypothetical protein
VDAGVDVDVDVEHSISSSHSPLDPHGADTIAARGLCRRRRGGTRNRTRSLNA